MESQILKIKIDNIKYNVVPNIDSKDAISSGAFVYSIGTTLLKKHGLDHWTISCEKLDNSVAGRCYYNSRKIAINTVCLYLMEFPTIEHIILHEIAHGLVGRTHGHDYQWHLTARSIGCHALTKLKYELQQIDKNTYKITFK